jgi:hypothetical protein
VPLFRRRRSTEMAVQAESLVETPPDLPTHWRAYADRLDDVAVELAELVAASDDFGVEPDPVGGWTVNLYDDVRGYVGDPAIEALEPKIAALDGVTRAIHEDREIIRVEGSITGEQLAAFVISELALTGDPHARDDL